MAPTSCAPGHTVPLPALGPAPPPARDPGPGPACPAGDSRAFPGTVVPPGSNTRMWGSLSPLTLPEQWPGAALGLQSPCPSRRPREVSRRRVDASDLLNPTQRVAPSTPRTCRSLCKDWRAPQGIVRHTGQSPCSRQVRCGSGRTPVRGALALSGRSSVRVGQGPGAAEGPQGLDVARGRVPRALRCTRSSGGSGARLIAECALVLRGVRGRCAAAAFSIGPGFSLVLSQHPPRR